MIRLLFGVVPHLRCFVVFLQFKPFFKSIGHIVAVRNQKLIIMRQFNLTDSLSSEKAGPPLPRRCIWMRMALVVLLAVFAVATMQAAIMVLESMAIAYGKKIATTSLESRA
uniref:hypothetical protein n=1 Tax=Candidatus Limisoma sp. TaxID=3076476 RepID=UPI0040285B88